MAPNSVPMKTCPEWDEEDKHRWISSARSCYPNEYLMNDFVIGFADARAIISSWHAARQMRKLVRTVSLPFPSGQLSRGEIGGVSGSQAMPSAERKMISHPSRLVPGMWIEELAP